MSSISYIDQYREIDPLTSPEVKKLVSIWHSGTIGGAERISHCIRGAFVGDIKDDMFRVMRNQQPKLLLILHPVLAAWSRDEFCDVEYIMEAVPQRRRGVILDWCETLREEGIIRAEQHGDAVKYVPTREVLYKVLDGMTFVIEFLELLHKEVPEAIDLLKNTKGNPWVSTDEPIPKETINETPR